jgi:hypothetical protein
MGLLPEGLGISMYGGAKTPRIHNAIRECGG